MRAIFRRAYIVRHARANIATIPHPGHVPMKLRNLQTDEMQRPDAAAGRVFQHPTCSRNGEGGEGGRSFRKRDVEAVVGAIRRRRIHIQNSARCISCAFRGNSTARRDFRRVSPRLLGVPRKCRSGWGLVSTRERVPELLTLTRVSEYVFV